MRWAILAAGVAASALATAPVALAQANKPDREETGRLQNAVVQEGVEPAQELRVTSPPNAAADRSYADPGAALLEADMDYIVREGRRALNRNVDDNVLLWSLAVFSDDFAAGRYTEARTTLENAPGGLR